jgi:hypothetical protein
MPVYFILISLMVSACAANFSGSTEAPIEFQPELSTIVDISFDNDVLPILRSRCVVCHGGERRESSLDLTSYSGLIAGSDSGPVIVPGDADNSLIVKLVLNGRMPKRAPKLVPTQIQTLIDWINQGALDN